MESQFLRASFPKDHRLFINSIIVLAYVDKTTKKIFFIFFDEERK